MKWIVMLEAADGTRSAAGPFTSLKQAEGWAADVELETTGDFSGMALELEDPAAVLGSFRETS